MLNSLFETFLLIIIFLPAIIFHELAHGYVAYLLGDSTAKAYGRLTLNPLKHLSLLGTLAIFLIGIGWAKPVPINTNNFQNPRRDIALTSLAGPMANFTLALISGLIITLLQMLPENSFVIILINIFFLFLFVNTTLMVFNLIPIPPLDGAGILGYFVPKRFREHWYKFESNGLMIFFIIVGVQYFFDIPIFSTVIFWPADKIQTFILLISGVN